MAIHRLENIFTYLRKLLRPPSGGESLVRSSIGKKNSGTSYCLESYPTLWMDCDALIWNIEQACRMEHFGDDPLPLWQRAFELLKRGPFLVDDPYEPYASWVKEQRELLQGYYRQCVHALSRLYIARASEAGKAEALLLLRTYWQQAKTDQDALRPLLELLGEQERYQEAGEYYQQLLLALVGLAPPVGVFLGTALIGGIFRGAVTVYYGLAGLLAVGTLLFLLRFKELPLPRGVMPALRGWEFLRDFWISPSRSPDFAWAWITRLLLVLGYASGQTLLLFFLTDAVHVSHPSTGVTLFQLISTVVLVVSSLVSGWLSDKVERRKPFVCVSGLLLALGLLLLAGASLTSSWSLVLITATVLGAGFGIYSATDVALVTQVLPSIWDKGRGMGIAQIAPSLAQNVLAPVQAGVFVSIVHSFPLFFLVGALCACAGGVGIWRIQNAR